MPTRHATGLLRLCVLLTLILPAVPRHVAAAPPTQGAHTPLMVYHELTQRPDGSPAIDAPVLSGDGRRAFWAESPPGSPPVNRVFARDIDGGQPTRIDTYQPLCECRTRLDVSDDGNTVVSTEGVRIRVLSGVATLGNPREVLRLANNAISTVRISGDGQIVIFMVVRDSTISEPNPRKRGAAIPRGVWAIGVGGGEPLQLAGVGEIAAAAEVPVAELQVNPTFHAAFETDMLDVSDDGRRVIFAAHAGKAGDGVFILGEGTPLTQLAGPVGVVGQVAVSGDGQTLAFMASDQPRGTVTVISSGMPESIPMNSLGVEERLQLSRDGTTLLGRGPRGYVLVDVATLAMRELIPLGPSSLSAAGPRAGLFVGDGAVSATMNAAGMRVLYVAGPKEPNSGTLVVITLGPPDLGGAPLVRGLHVDPTTVPRDGAKTVSVTAEISWDGTLIGAWLDISRSGEPDATFGASPVTLLEGSVGQAPGRVQGVFGTTLQTGTAPAAPGPRQLRVMSESQGEDGRRHGTVLQADTTLTVGDVGLGGRYQGEVAVADAHVAARLTTPPGDFTALHDLHAAIDLDPTTQAVLGGSLSYEAVNPAARHVYTADTAEGSGPFQVLPGGILGRMVFHGELTVYETDGSVFVGPVEQDQVFLYASDPAGRVGLCADDSSWDQLQKELETQRQECLAQAFIELQSAP